MSESEHGNHDEPVRVEWFDESGQYAGTAGAPRREPVWPTPPARENSEWARPVSQADQRRHRGLIAGLVAAMLVVTVGLGIGIGHLVWPGAQNGPAPRSAFSFPGTSFPFGSNGFGGFRIGESPSGAGGSSTSPVTPGSGSPSDVSAIAAKVDPALVDINTSMNYQQATGAGTGIVISSTGEVITNNHVIKGATSISVVDVGNGRTYAAKVVGYDPSRDIAVLQLANASGLTTARIATASSAVTGEPVVAVGNAGGTGGTPSAAGGSVTALDQSITANDSLDGSSEQLTGLIGVNADVQPGDSGGSLVNQLGHVIGIDVAAASGSGQYSVSAPTSTSIGYAIPIHAALAIASEITSGAANSLIHTGRTAFLGVSISTVSQADQSNGFSGTSSGSSGATGAYVENVVSGGAAARAGVVSGDVITALDGHSVTSPSDVTTILLPHHPGDSVVMSYTDSSGTAHTSSVVLGAGPPA